MKNQAKLKKAHRKTILLNLLTKITKVKKMLLLRHLEMLATKLLKIKTNHKLTNLLIISKKMHLALHSEMLVTISSNKKKHKIM